MAEPSLLPAAAACRGRRRFLKAAAGILSGFVAAAAAVPLVGMLFGPIYRKQQSHFERVGPIEGFPVGRPVNPTFEYRTDDAYLRKIVLTDVWVVRLSATDVAVYSSICPHLGCHVYWDEQAKQFICPCHASLFSLAGQVLGGPAPRPLDTLTTKVEAGELFVEWQRGEKRAEQRIGDEYGGSCVPPRISKSTHHNASPCQENRAEKPGVKSHAPT